MKAIYFILIISISFGAKGQEFENSQTIINPDGNEHFDDFGGSVLAGEGIVFIGAPAEDETNDERTMNDGSFPYLYGGVGKGKVYVYSKETGSWQKAQEITIDDPNDHSFFGFSMATYGNVLFVGAPKHSYDENGANEIAFSGAVYMYKLDGGQWEFKEKIVSPNRSSQAFFGYSIAANSNSLFIGAPMENGGDGSVYKYSYSVEDGTTFESDVERPDIHGDLASFGIEVDANDDHLVILGGQGNRGNGKGIYTFSLDNGQVYPSSQDLGYLATDGINQSLDIHGNQMVTGQTDRMGSYGCGFDMICGVMNYYHYDGTEWILEQEVPLSPGSEMKEGFTVDIHGMYLAMGNRFDRKVHLYEKEDGLFQYVVTIDVEATSGIEFGTQISMSDGLLVASAPTSGSTDKAYIMESSRISTSVDENIAIPYSIYPNPTNGIIHIGGVLNAPPIQIELYDLQGKILDQLEGNTIDIRRYSSGNYMLVIRSSTRSSAQIIHKN